MAFIGNSVQTQGFAPAIDYFSGNGSTVTFTLSRNIASVAQVICAIDNVIQNPSSAYTVSGNAITFTSAPLSGTNNIWVEYTSLITTYAAISQSPSVIGDITASGGYLAVGSFGNSFIDGTVVDYTTGNGRITVGSADGFTLYNGGTSARSALLALNSSGAMGVGTSPSYGTAGQVLVSGGASAAPTWVSLPISSTIYAQYCVVAGGGAGGGGGGRGGGGGAGGVLTGITSLSSGTTYTVTIGAGGTGTANATGGNGSNSVFTGFTSTGGGGGGGSTGTLTGASGGSGGGAGSYSGSGGTGGTGTSGQGFKGGDGNNSPECTGGGGGAGGPGFQGYAQQPGPGGSGIYFAPSNAYYGGGGGAGGDYTNAGQRPGYGGVGGGGWGGAYTTNNATAGTANTGGGGGGNSGGSIAGASGGSGIVVISIPTSQYSGTTTGSPTVTTNGPNTVIKWTSSGSYTA